MDVYLDNSAFSLLNCARKFQLRVGAGLVEPKGGGAAFGDAVHKGLEFLDKGETPDSMTKKLQAYCKGVDVPKVLATVATYKMTKKLPEPVKLLDDKPGIELKFKHLYAQMMLPGSHERLNIYLVGTIDRIHIQDEVLVIMDYKTTQAATPYKIKDVLDSYALAFQLPFYLYACKNFGILPAAYKDYIDQRRYRMEIHLLAVNITPTAVQVYRRMPFPDDFIDREVPLIINTKIQEAVNVLSLATAAPHTGMTVYKACDDCGFRNACLVMGTEREDQILSTFPKSTYDPLSWR